MHKDENAEMCRKVGIGGMIRVVAGTFEGFPTFTRRQHRRMNSAIIRQNSFLMQFACFWLLYYQSLICTTPAPSQLKL
jgi:hypothetical protein